MRRAFRALALAVFVAASCAAVANAIPVKIVNRINAIGLVDYTHRPSFKVGDFVRYRVNTTTDGAESSAYLLTVLIAGEEEFWGEKCFWLETWTDDVDGRKESVASLMSYDVFRDSLADERIQLYRRKLINGIDENGLPAEELIRGTANLGSIRSAPNRPTGYDVDTVGVDTVQTPLGLIHARHVDIMTGKQATRTEGDSTVYLENRETRSRWLAPEVAITRVAREDTRTTSGRRAWKLGYSRESGPMIVKETSVVSARVVEAGHGLKARLVPPARATSFEQQAAARRAAPARKGATAARR
jgi:hypothetical protein